MIKYKRNNKLINLFYIFISTYLYICVRYTYIIIVVRNLEALRSKPFLFFIIAAKILRHSLPYSRKEAWYLPELIEDFPRKILWRKYFSICILR